MLPPPPCPVASRGLQGPCLHGHACRAQEDTRILRVAAIKPQTSKQANTDTNAFWLMSSGTPDPRTVKNYVNFLRLGNECSVERGRTQKRESERKRRETTGSVGVQGGSRPRPGCTGSLHKALNKENLAHLASSWGVLDKPSNARSCKVCVHGSGVPWRLREAN